MEGERRENVKYLVDTHHQWVKGLEHPSFMLFENEFFVFVKRPKKGALIRYRFLFGLKPFHFALKIVN